MDDDQNEDAIKILARVRELPELSYRARVLVDRALVALGMPDPDKAPRFTAADVRRVRDRTGLTLVQAKLVLDAIE